MESSIFLLGPLKGVFWHFKVERPRSLSGTVRILTSKLLLNKFLSNLISSKDNKQQAFNPTDAVSELFSILTTCDFPF